MLKTLLLSAPIFTTLFWAMLLNFSKENRNIPQLFLGKFMIMAFVIYVSHFLFFEGLSTAYLCIDIAYQYATLMVYPMFYIYVRLLTVDRQFSFRKHLRFILPSTILVALYALGVISLSASEYADFAFIRNTKTDNDFVYLTSIFYVMKTFAVIQVIMVVTASQRLIVKYQDRAAQFYSDDAENKVSTLKIQNIGMVITGVASVLLISFGRLYFVDKLEIVGVAGMSITFSTMLFMLGWLGNKQSVINPTYELAREEIPSEKQAETDVYPGELHNKIHTIMKEQKLYLNPQLNIRELALALGTNRTTLSAYINNNYKQNFCKYVNSYRITELELQIKNNPENDNFTLAVQCGFGSVISMKRAISAQTGITLQEWKEQI